MKVISDYRADLLLDLKGVITTDWSGGELDRCVERAVADLTRFRPLQKSAEYTVDATVSAESFTTPAASDPDYFVDNKGLAASVDGETVTTATTPALAAQTPDVPRPVMITVTDDGTTITDLVIIVKGRDAGGSYMEEYFYLAGGLVQTGVKYFATVTEVELEEIAGRSANDKLDVGTGSHFGVYVQLANKPIKFNSDAISGYTKDTHYIMDYYNGRIAMKDAATGDMVVATAYSIAYTKSKITIDLSDLDDLVRVERVEYPVGTVPQEMSTKEMWGSILTITSDNLASQAEMSDAEHVLVHYLAQHQPPGASVSGTYPSFLDQTVELAASAYALFIKALQYEHQAATDFGEVRTTLDYLGIGGVGAAALTLVYKKLDDALDKVALYLETNDTTDNAVDVLANITDDVADLRTAITAALDIANVGLGKAGSGISYSGTVSGTFQIGESCSGGSSSAVGIVVGAGAKHITVITLTGTFTASETITGATSSATITTVVIGTVGGDSREAEVLLQAGDDLIDQLNDGKDVPEIMAEYARVWAQTSQARTQVAITLMQEAQVRLANLRTHIEEAGGWNRIAEDFIAEAQARMGEIDRYLAEAAQYQELGANNLILADRLRTEAIERRNEAWSIWSSPPQYAPQYTLTPR